MASALNSRQLFFELVISEIWSRPIDPSLFEGGVDWLAIMRIAQEQTMLGVVANSINRLPTHLQPSREIGLKLHHRVTLNRQQYHYQIKGVGDLLDDLRSADVPRGVVLKGLGISQNYPDPSARMCGDVDLWVGESHYANAVTICEDTEYEEDHKHFEFHYKKIPVELHRYVTNAETISRKRDKIFAWFEGALSDGDHTKHITLGDRDIEVPDATFNAIFIFLHAYEHLVKGGIGLRQICDWALLLDRQYDEIDHATVEELLERHNMRVIWDVFIKMIDTYLRFDMRKSPFACDANAASAKLVMDVVMERGNFGKHAQRGNISSNYAIKQFQTFGIRVSELGFLFKIDKRIGFCTLRNIVTGGFGRTMKRLFHIKP